MLCLPSSLLGSSSSTWVAVGMLPEAEEVWGQGGGGLTHVSHVSLHGGVAVSICCVSIFK